jgi:multiple sugar transport system substrate-binding protein
MRKIKSLLLVGLVLLVSTSVFAKNKIVLNYWTHTDDNRYALESKYIAEFEKLNPDVEIKRNVNEAAKMGEIVLTAFSANNGPDIFNLPIEQEYSYMVNGRVAPVDCKAIGYKNFNVLKAAYMKKTFDAITLNKKIYGLPLELTNWSIFINKKIFRSAGLNPEKDYPRTWEDMADISEKLVLRNGNIIKRRGFDFRYPYYLVSFIPMVQQLGGDLLDPTGKKAIVNDKAWLKLLNYMKEWGPNGKNLGSPTYTNARKIFDKDNNDIAMCLSGFYQEGRLRDDNLAFYNSKEWMVVPFPVFKGAVKKVACAYYGHFMMVNAQSSKEKQKLAWKFAKYMLDHPMEYLEKVNIIQPRNELINSAVFKKMPYTKVFMDDMKRAKPVTTHQNGPQIERYIKEAVEAVMLTNTSPEVALKDLKKKIQEVLDEN